MTVSRYCRHAWTAPDSFPVVHSKLGQKLREHGLQIERRTARAIVQNRGDCKRLRISLPDGNPRGPVSLRSALAKLALGAT